MREGRTSSRDRLEALLRLEATVRRDPSEALHSLLEEVRRLTGADCAMLAVLEDVGGDLHQSVLASASGPESRIRLTDGEHWPWGESGCIVLRGEGRVHARDFGAEHPGHRRAADLSLRGFVSLPVTSADGSRVVASMCVLDTDPLDLDEECLGLLRLLTGVATGPLREQLARDEVRSTEERSRAATKEVLSGVRRAQDELGNGLAVALGRLRLATDPESPGADEHVVAALSRLERLSAAGAPALRDLRTAALDGALLTPVDLRDALARGRPEDGTRGADEGRGIAAADQPAAWALGDPGRIAGVLATVGDALEGSLVTTPELVLLPLRDPSVLTTELLLDLEASGGRVAEHSGTPALAWVATTPVVPT